MKLQNFGIHGTEYKAKIQNAHPEVLFVAKVSELP